jgi:hypothetical protein
MKLVHYIEKISGVDFYGIVSLTMFVTFFTIMLIWVFTARKTTIDEIKNIPLN